VLQALVALQKRQRRLEDIDNKRLELEALVAQNGQACSDLDTALWERNTSKVRVVRSERHWPFLYAQRERRAVYMQVWAVLEHNPFSRDTYYAALEALRTGSGVPEDDGSLSPESSPYFLDWETRMGSTALNHAAIQGQAGLVLELVKREARLDHENRLGHTALTWACVCGHDEVGHSQTCSR
jgi:hypothetical protein